MLSQCDGGTSPTPREPLGRVGRAGPEQPCLPAGLPQSLGPCLLTMAPSAQHRASTADSAQQSGHSQEERNRAQSRTTLRLLPGTRLGMQQVHRLRAESASLQLALPLLPGQLL